MTRIALEFSRTAASIWVDVGEFVKVRKSNWGSGIGWVHSVIRCAHSVPMSPKEAEQMLAELQRAIEVANELDKDPNWRPQ